MQHSAKAGFRCIDPICFSSYKNFHHICQNIQKLWPYMPKTLTIYAFLLTKNSTIYAKNIDHICFSSYKNFHHVCQNIQKLWPYIPKTLTIYICFSSCKNFHHISQNIQKIWPYMPKTSTLYAFLLAKTSTIYAKKYKNFDHICQKHRPYMLFFLQKLPHKKKPQDLQIEKIKSHLSRRFLNMK